MVDLKKAIKQQEAIEAVRENDYNGAVLATVGYGKGRVILTLLKYLVKNKKVKTILYLCDNTRLRDKDFPAEVEKWDDENIVKGKIEYACYQTAHKWINKKWDVVVGDEFDAAITKKYINVFFNNSFSYKMLFSGTLSKAKRSIAETIVPIVYTYTTTEAENDGLLNKSNYYLYNYRLSDSESKEYTKWTNTWIKANAAEKDIKTLQYLLGKRREVLYTSDSSYEHTRKVMQWLWNRDKKTRLIIFCERTSQADRVCKWSYHGGNIKKENLDKFQSGEISALAVVSKIKRGINLKNANAAIYEAMNGGSSTEFEQENGRLKRLPVSQIATCIFMVPWFFKIDEDGEKVWKPTVVKSWIEKATVNLTNIEFENLKL